MYYFKYVIYREIFEKWLSYKEAFSLKMGADYSGIEVYLPELRCTLKM